MQNHIETRGLSAGSLFKILFIGLMLSMGPLIILCGIFALFGKAVVFVNGQAVTGVMGLIASIIMAPIFSAIFAGLLWLLLIFGLWIYTRFKTIKIGFKI